MLLDREKDKYLTFSQIIEDFHKYTSIVCYQHDVE